MLVKPHLLLLPGMVCDEAFWRPQLGALAAISQPRVMGYGLLDSFEAMAEAVLDQAPERFALAGHSMGGRIALEVFRRAPDRVLRLALLATDYRAPESAQALAGEIDRRDGMLARVAAEGMQAFARMWVNNILPPHRLKDRALVEDVVAMMARQAPEVLAAQTKAALTRADHTELLSRITCPTLICAGEMDALRPVEVHRQMAALIPGSRLVVVEGAGHMVAMEQPEAVTSALLDWLAALPEASRSRRAEQIMPPEWRSN